MPRWSSTISTSRAVGHGRACGVRRACPTAPEGPDEARVARAIPRLLHLDDPNRLALYKRAVAGELSDDDLDPSSSPGRALMGLHFSIWGLDSDDHLTAESIDRLRQHPALAMELSELFDILEDQADHVPEPLDDQMRWPHRIPLAVHSRASLDEIMAAFGRMTFDRPNRLRQGVDFDRATEQRPVLRHAREGRGPLLAIHDVPRLRDLAGPVPLGVAVDDVGAVANRSALPAASGQGHPRVSVRAASQARGGKNGGVHVPRRRRLRVARGSRPIAITWRLRKPMPDDFFREAKVAAG